MKLMQHGADAIDAKQIQIFFSFKKLNFFFTLHSKRNILLNYCQAMSTSAGMGNGHGTSREKFELTMETLHALQILLSALQTDAHRQDDF